MDAKEGGGGGGVEATEALSSGDVVVVATGNKSMPVFPPRGSDPFLKPLELSAMRVHFYSPMSFVCVCVCVCVWYLNPHVLLPVRTQKK